MKVSREQKEVAVCFFFNDTATTEIYTLSLHDALPICRRPRLAAARRRGDLRHARPRRDRRRVPGRRAGNAAGAGRHEARRSEEHTSELQSRQYPVCRLLLEKKKLTHLPYSSFTVDLLL